MAFRIEELKQFLVEKKYTVRYNVITRKGEVKGLDKKYSEEHYEDVFPTVIYDEIQTVHKGVTMDKVCKFLNVLTTNARYNPVLELLRNKKWDNIDRLPQIYKILGVEDEDTLSKTLIRKWLIQCYAMTKNNISNAYGADGLLVLVGAQGLGKTSFFRHIAMEQSLFGEGKSIDFSDKDTYRRAASVWICELGEIEHTLRGDIEKLKAFITDGTDMYRLPYGKGDLHLARRTSLCGTCNNTEFLADQTGNRRFWTVPVNKIDLDLLNQFNALQLWLQIATTENIQSFRLDGEERAELELRNKAHEKAYKAEDEIRDIIEKAEDSSQWSYNDMTVTDFITRNDCLKKYTSKQVSLALDKIGVKQIMKRINGSPGRYRRLPKFNPPCDSIG